MGLWQVLRARQGFRVSAASVLIRYQQSTVKQRVKTKSRLDVSVVCVRHVHNMDPSTLSMSDKELLRQRMISIGNMFVFSQQPTHGERHGCMHNCFAEFGNPWQLYTHHRHTYIASLRPKQQPTTLSLYPPLQVWVPQQQLGQLDLSAARKVRA